MRLLKFPRRENMRLCKTCDLFWVWKEKKQKENDDFYFKIVAHVKFNLHTTRTGGGKLFFPQGARRVSVVLDNFPEDEKHRG